MIVHESDVASLSRVEHNKRFLTDLFTGPFPGHAIIMNSKGRELESVGDFAISERPIEDFVPHYIAQYADRVRYHEALSDESVPYVGLNTNTGVFAAAFGCPIHVYDMATNAAARPIVSTPEEADALAQPTVEAPTLRRVLEMAERMRRELGPDAPISVPDIQSPFDIAALIWNKEDFFVALLTDPDAVKRLVGKCATVLKGFVSELKARVGNVNLCHCPYAWAPSELGIWLSEDEAGSISREMFAEFCLPTLVDLSETFGGMFMHCCAAADHQYEEFLKVPNLRGLNRVYTADPQHTIDAFGSIVHMVAWRNEQDCYTLLDMARPETRFLFNMDALEIGEARDLIGRMGERFGR
jgi:hypothetical protein